MGALPTFVPLMKVQAARHLDREIRPDEIRIRPRPVFQYESNQPALVKVPPKPRDVIHVMTPPKPVEAPEPFPDTVLPTSHWRVIVREVCEKYGIPVVDLYSDRRARHIVHARQEAMYRIRHETTLSYPQIGLRLGRKHHTTVYHGVLEHAKRLEAMNAQ